MTNFIYKVSMVYIDIHIIAYLLGVSVDVVTTFINNEAAILIKNAFTFHLTYLQLQVIALFAIICAMLLFATLLFVVNVSEHKRKIIATDEALIADLKAQVSQLQLELDLANKNDDIDRLTHVIANMEINNKLQ
jgi:hypothetical protein